MPDPDSILLIQRAERPGDPWSGHMGLPGGRRASEDEPLVATAIRETLEEVGVPLGASHLAGPLDDVAPRSALGASMVVRPFVFLLDRRPGVVPNPEVGSVFWVRMEELRHRESYRPTELEVRGERRMFDAYHLRGQIIWGMTERILTPLLELAGF